jgi:hypothetical protein
MQPPIAIDFDLAIPFRNTRKLCASVPLESCENRRLHIAPRTEYELKNWQQGECLAAVTTSNRSMEIENPSFRSIASTMPTCQIN